MDNEIKEGEIVNLEDELSKSQLMRIDLQNEVFKDLMNFLRNHIQTLQARNDLKEEVENEILNRVRAEGVGFSTNHLLRLYEVLSRESTEKSVGILSVLQKGTNINLNAPSPTPVNPTTPKKEIEFSKEEIATAKDLLEVLKELIKTEHASQENLTKEKTNLTIDVDKLLEEE
jgi:hypothetical protein